MNHTVNSNRLFVFFVGRDGGVWGTGVLFYFLTNRHLATGKQGNNIMTGVTFLSK